MAFFVYELTPYELALPIAKTHRQTPNVVLDLWTTRHIHCWTSLFGTYGKCDCGAFVDRHGYIFHEVYDA